MSLAKWINFQSLGDSRGSLVAIEIGLAKAVPFDIKRIYYIYETGMGVNRGFHAHRKLKQVAICLSGKCRMVLDNGIKRDEIWLSSPTQGLFIESMIWREMYDFTEDCILLVLASQHYDEADYIRNYDSFKQALLL